MTWPTLSSGTSISSSQLCEGSAICINRVPVFTGRFPMRSRTFQVTTFPSIGLVISRAWSFCSRMRSCLRRLAPTTISALRSVESCVLSTGRVSRGSVKRIRSSRPRMSSAFF